MRIGIIGAGNIGGTLARRLTALGHEVSIANSRGPETLAGLAKESGAKPVTAREAAQAGEVVIVTIPLKNVARLPADLFAENGTTESRWASSASTGWTLGRWTTPGGSSRGRRSIPPISMRRESGARWRRPGRSVRRSFGRRPFRPLDRSGLTCDRRGGAST